MSGNPATEYMGVHMITYGPVELRVKWVNDTEPYDPGDAEDLQEVNRYIELYGVMGCVVETRAPACGCCGRTDWEHAASLWSIVGDREYRAEIEGELIDEAMG